MQLFNRGETHDARYRASLADVAEWQRRQPPPPPAWWPWLLSAVVLVAWGVIGMAVWTVWEWVR